MYRHSHRPGCVLLPFVISLVALVSGCGSDGDAGWLRFREPLSITDAHTFVSRSGIVVDRIHAGVRADDGDAGSIGANGTIVVAGDTDWLAAAHARPQITPEDEVLIYAVHSRRVPRSVRSAHEVGSFDSYNTRDIGW